MAKKVRSQLGQVQGTPQGPHRNSKAVWQSIKEQLTVKRQAIFDVLMSLPGRRGTHNQVSHGLQGGPWWTSSNNANKLLGEMARWDVVVRLPDPIACPLSGQECTVWKLTGRPPQSPGKRVRPAGQLTRPELVARVATLQRENKRLQRRINSMKRDCSHRMPPPRSAWPCRSARTSRPPTAPSLRTIARLPSMRSTTTIPVRTPRSGSS